MALLREAILMICLKSDKFGHFFVPAFMAPRRTKMNQDGPKLPVLFVPALIAETGNPFYHFFRSRIHGPKTHQNQTSDNIRQFAFKHPCKRYCFVAAAIIVESAPMSSANKGN